MMNVIETTMQTLGNEFQTWHDNRRRRLSGRQIGKQGRIAHEEAMLMMINPDEYWRYMKKMFKEVYCEI